MLKVLLTTTVLLFGPSVLAQDNQPLPAPGDVKLEFSTAGDQHQFHLGELIPVSFAYSAAIPGKFIQVSSSNKLIGGRGIQIACSPAAEPIRFSPALSWAVNRFEAMLQVCGGVAGGGIGSACGDCDGEWSLSNIAVNFGSAPLNSFIRFRSPGKYTCTAASADITTDPRGATRRQALLVWSNPLVLSIAEDAVWAHSAAANYAAAYQKLCLGKRREDVLSQCFDIAARLTYLDSVDSLASEVKFFDGKPYGWDNGFEEAIRRTSHQTDAVRLMTARIQEPDFQASTFTLEWLASTHLKGASPDAFESTFPATYHAQAVDEVRRFVRLLGSSLPRKNSDVLQESAKTYSNFAQQNYCDGQPLISEEEQKQVLVAAGLQH
jgi:hypothetical protein